MQAEHKKIIVKEIQYWSKNKLLPDQYCDFLLNLYSEETDKKQSKFGEKLKYYKYMIYFAVLGLISYIALYFTSFYWPMQIAAGLAVVIPLYAAGSLKRNVNPSTSLVYMASASVLMVAFGIYILHLHQLDHPFMLNNYVFLCGVVWITLGIAARQTIIQVSGWIAVLFVYGMLIMHSIVQQWSLLWELLWLPSCLLIFYISWALRSLQINIKAFFWLSAVAWFVPESVGIVQHAGMLIITMLVLFKAAVITALIRLLKMKRFKRT